eukprot:TRINITY_DN10952_c0_g1_i1.p1 TRINITY_DN10952_c0_g1~~TRINITY_DN10952_c0_g1_i1.p1  ORF type:complete len:344 (-),score=66.30 TRINITY_DN10952_c0_g1_i1:50-1081(-)
MQSSVSNRKTINIAIAACSNYSTPGNYWTDDQWLMEQLLQFENVQVQIIDWKDTNVDLLKFDSIFVSTVWDYIHDPDAFLEFLNNCEIDSNKRLINDYQILSKGVLKSDYMVGLIDHFGCSDDEHGYMTPTLFYVKDDSIINPFEDALQKFHDMYDWDGDLVIKPVTSCDGNNTFTYKRESNTNIDDQNAEELFLNILNSPTANGVIIQQYIHGIDDHGEYSLVYFNHELSHTVQKPVGFKAGTHAAKRQVIEPRDLPPNMKAFGEKIIEYLEQMHNCILTRTRVDLFCGASGPVICEIEFVEPSTNIHYVDIVSTDMRKNIINNYATVILNRTKELISVREN